MNTIVSLVHILGFVMIFASLDLDHLDIFTRKCITFIGCVLTVIPYNIAG